ncbi:MAG: bifunctional phosphoribosylaminoimidazolecarboxamide formyltransferase/IMP cyclohydrolase PurH [Saprospirales bacterium]|nr:MAG: bifunctional phosphoribosylaminoimidazolecarboxamide formyltransferase/IMP cyclohydrolase PurH [Saprospirales bacterium]
MANKRIKRVLISVFSKKGISQICQELDNHDVEILSTGGTAAFIESLGIKVTKVEDITGFPSILEGRVKTLHPSVFGGILAKSEDSHLKTLQEYSIPQIDAVIVDLYPFSETVADGGTHEEIIEKIDIGGVSLIRAAAKNYAEVVVVPSANEYAGFLDLILKQSCSTTLEQRKELSKKAFLCTVNYDSEIAQYFGGSKQLRYGENPHQNAEFNGILENCFVQLNGKELSYNNLLDIDAAFGIMAEVSENPPTFSVIKHNNMCGFAEAPTVLQAWQNALACDPVSAFGGIITTNRILDLETATEIDKIFYEVLIAPDYHDDALELLLRKKKRIILKLNKYPQQKRTTRTVLNGQLTQDQDLHQHSTDDWRLSTKVKASSAQLEDLLFANRLVKHLKSNAISLVKNKTLIGMGAGQTSRVDALNHAIQKAIDNGFDLRGAVMASDAFFPFNDCVEIAYKSGITAVVQPGGSIKDQDSIDFCNDHEMSMYLTGFRHFKH